MESTEANKAKVEAKRTTTKGQLSITTPEVHEYVPRASSKNNSRTSKKSPFNFEKAYYESQEKLKVKEGEVVTLKHYTEVLGSERDDYKKESELLVAMNNQSLNRLGAITEERPEASKIDDLLKRLLKSDQLIDALARERTENTEVIRRVHAENGICRNTIHLLKEDIKETENALEAKEILIKTKDESLKIKDETLKTKDLAIKTSELAVQAKDVALKTLEEKIRDIKEQLSDEVKKSTKLELSNSEKDATIHNYKTKSVEDTQLNDKLTSEVDKLTSEVNQMRQEMMDQHAKLHENEVTIEQLQTELQFTKDNTFKKKCKRLFSCKSSRSQTAKCKQPIAKKKEQKESQNSTVVSSSTQAQTSSRPTEANGNSDTNKSTTSTLQNAEQTTLTKVTDCKAADKDKKSGEVQNPEVEIAKDETNNESTISAGEAVTSRQTKDGKPTTEKPDIKATIPIIIVTSASVQDAEVARGPPVAPKPRRIASLSHVHTSDVSLKQEQVGSVTSTKKVVIVESQAVATKQDGVQFARSANRVGIAESQAEGLKVDDNPSGQSLLKYTISQGQITASKSGDALGAHLESEIKTPEATAKPESEINIEVTGSEAVVSKSDATRSIPSMHNERQAGEKKPNLAFSVTTIVSCTPSATETEIALNTVNTDGATSVDDQNSTNRATMGHIEVTGRPPNST
ncbi:ankycorbin-like [Clytia hemisphaerica]